MDRIIRPYQSKDLDDVMSAWESASQLAHPFLKEDFLDQERHNIPNAYLPNADTWVIEEAGQVIGFIALMGNEVGALFVKPDFHGTGAGKALMDKAQELHGDLEVQVFKENRIGQKFYARYGFQYLSEQIYEPTGNMMIRLKFSAENSA